jgi:BON domain-containing protein
MPRLRKHAGRRPSALVPRVLFVGELRRPARLRKPFAGQLATVAASALAAGVALEFFLDPRNGTRRRRLVRDRLKATLRRRARGLERQTRYEAGKVAGIAHRISHPQHEPAELDDISLVHKVESELFRDRSIPKGRISINADRGIVVLRGQLDDPQDIERVEREVRKVAGVRDVDNLLHLPGAPAPASRPHGEPRAASSAE